MGTDTVNHHVRPLDSRVEISPRVLTVRSREVTRTAGHVIRRIFSILALGAMLDIRVHGHITAAKTISERLVLTERVIDGSNRLLGQVRRFEHGFVHRGGRFGLKEILLASN